MAMRRIAFMLTSLVGICSLWGSDPGVWHGMIGVPVHGSPIGTLDSLKQAKDEDEMRRIMKASQTGNLESVAEHPEGPNGPCALISGEYFNWDYSFPWNGVTNDKVVHPLHRGDLLRFMSLSDDQKTLYLQLRSGELISTWVPPFVQLGNILKLGKIPLQGTIMYVVKNRFGAPTKIDKSEEGGEIWTYSNSKASERDVVENQVSDTSGVLTDPTSFGSVGYEHRTVTKVHHKERIKYSNYDFSITFSPSGVVEKVEDHWQAPNWIRDN